MHTREEQLTAIDRLLTIMDELRVKCPWDAKQTFESLRNLTVEEVYELADSIDQQDNEELKKELGDVLMHIVFYAKIGSEQSLFDIKTIADAVSDKLIYRHPHIYGDVQVEDEEEVKANWEKLKLKEGNKSVLGGVPKGLPALIKAYRIQDKASGVGFDWDNKEDVWAKFKEEIEEFKVEEVKDDKELMEEEFGDMLFSLINYARFVKLDPEKALARANNKFINRFQGVEQMAVQAGKSIADLSVEEMNEYWDKVKLASK
ncbi:nucleoside triphosphate pyrophosphohydrolase [Myroides pelagicus]|uniref:Nucleoside triphosphate pyrophosphohydrolase n=1 Tax=Myroides pelagicus TaxID=270914 RepID=A0A7K1GHH9_9FLAO|nr:nucleoside triphosphate pyrophosphohydrolase [Myroides pelagicus]MEC4114611.1 nucleoside triphosphate pyrophosphohydrolase [Myroides pelagicus]MTH28386.1 nucleoside triphosphate pyrophosphohydrolase [Myroides pelagicus]